MFDGFYVCHANWWYISKNLYIRMHILFTSAKVFNQAISLLTAFSLSHFWHDIALFFYVPLWFTATHTHIHNHNQTNILFEYYFAVQNFTLKDLSHILWDGSRPLISSIDLKYVWFEYFHLFRLLIFATFCELHSKEINYLAECLQYNPIQSIQFLE